MRLKYIYIPKSISIYLFLLFEVLLHLEIRSIPYKTLTYFPFAKSIIFDIFKCDNDSASK